MAIGPVVRYAALGATIVLGVQCFMHWDAVQVPGTGYLFRDLLSGELFRESALEKGFFAMVLAAILTLLLLAVHWSRKRAEHKGA
ncbi:MAG: hypothetical protein ABI432_02225 [Flavobacteriales bacterium]